MLFLNRTLSTRVGLYRINEWRLAYPHGGTVGNVFSWARDFRMTPRQPRNAVRQQQHGNNSNTATW